MRSPRIKLQRRDGFTLVELLVVVTIVLILMSFTVASVNFMLNAERVSSATRQVQSYLEGARDRAIRANEPRGVRFMIDQELTTSLNEDLVALGTTPPAVITSMSYVRPGDSWTQGHIQMERNPALADPTLATIVAGSVDTNWWLLKKRGVLYNGLRVKIPNSRSGTWYTLNVDAIDTTGHFPPLPSVDNLYPYKIAISPPYRDPATTPRTQVRAFSTNYPDTYELELAPTLLPNEPVLLSESTLIDLASSTFPGLSAGTGTHFDLMFTSRGSVMGGAAASGLVHLYVGEVDAAQALRDYYVENNSAIVGTVIPADEMTLSGETVPMGDRRVLSLFTQTGAISTSPIDPTDADADQFADDPFSFAENGEVANN